MMSLGEYFMSIKRSGHCGDIRSNYLQNTGRGGQMFLVHEYYARCRHNIKFLIVALLLSVTASFSTFRAYSAVTNSPKDKPLPITT